VKPLSHEGCLSGFAGGLRLAAASALASQSTSAGYAPFLVWRSAYVCSMSDHSTEGRFRVSPVDCRGRAIATEVLSVAYEISGRALSHAENVLGDPALALSAFEETAATVSRVLSAQERSGNRKIRNLSAYLFRAFLRRVNRLKRRELLFGEHSTNELLESLISSSREELELKLLVDELLTRCDAVTRDMFYRRVQGFSWKEIGRTYGISAHAAESRFSAALRRVRKRLHSQPGPLEGQSGTSSRC